MGDKIGVSEQTSRMILWSLIESSFSWIRFRFGFDMKRVQDGVVAIHGSQVPVLLIHGSNERGTPVAGAQRLRDANPQRSGLVAFHGADYEEARSHRSLDRRLMARCPEVDHLLLFGV
jgi:pimeloyl-ACP methyl ester carboxylesterase